MWLERSGEWGMKGGGGGSGEEDSSSRRGRGVGVGGGGAGRAMMLGGEFLDLDREKWGGAEGEGRDKKTKMRKRS